MIALFGGTFDPVHLGHVHLAETLLKHYHFEKIIFIPAAQNPLKSNSPIASNADRLKMLKASLLELNETKFEISDFELKRSGQSFTVDTIESFKNEYPDKEFALILGDEVFNAFSEWHSPLSIINYVNLIIISRSKLPLEIEKTLLKIKATPRQLSENKWTHNNSKNFVEYFKFESLSFSSTRIRETLCGLWGIKNLEEKNIIMPQGIQRSVWQVVKVNKLYAVNK